MSWQMVAMAAAGLALLGACADLDDGSYRVFEPPEATFATASPAWDRAVERALTEAPFAKGPMAVVANEEGEIDVYRLVPCRDGRAICAGGPEGAAGTLRRTPDWFVVEGLYGRTFWLGYGGDGYVERAGRFVPLAWNARPLGTGPGDDPALETAFRHD
ncbi:hypothetical protein [Rubellimicrobium roseum]|uniref:Lipoprotein n=1 Tax=Rubellimicrobium roseum TaxID=687525 RepID=A0A5C4NE27_9RHOB|nr:hypothetical protein [Rubellimicrobium roseum]TNC72392.1 hypothetical protein FHG71_08360 [Rubellimicrobium roseum]